VKPEASAKSGLAEPLLRRLGPSDWILVGLCEPPKWGKLRSIAAIAGLIFMIGEVDYLFGADVSLRPFYSGPVILAVIWLGWRTAIPVAFLSSATWFLSDYFAGSTIVRGLPGVWNLLIVIWMELCLIWMIQSLITLQARIEAKVVKRTEALNESLAAQERLRWELLGLTARERNSMGQELHDGLCQHLTGTALAAQVLAEKLDRRGEPSAGEARKLVGLIQEGISQTRGFAHGLLLATIEPDNLVAELQELCSATLQVSGIECNVEAGKQARAPDPTTAAELFRIAQEAVRNAVRHAGARSIQIILTADNRDFVMEIVDDGCGFTPAGRSGPGLGIGIMEHRAASISGRFSIRSSSGGGTCVRCAVPRSPVLSDRRRFSETMPIEANLARSA
jgi:signal transduction histidine kinase